MFTHGWHQLLPLTRKQPLIRQSVIRLLQNDSCDTGLTRLNLTKSQDGSRGHKEELRESSHMDSTNSTSESCKNKHLRYPFSFCITISSRRGSSYYNCHTTVWIPIQPRQPILCFCQAKGSTCENLHFCTTSHRGSQALFALQHKTHYPVL